MKLSVVVLVLTVASGLVAGCSAKVDSSDLNVSLTTGKCTNSYSASSKSELCASLEDDKKDQCGMRSMRESEFKRSCDGTFDPHY